MFSDLIDILTVMGKVINSKVIFTKFSINMIYETMYLVLDYC